MKVPHPMSRIIGEPDHAVFVREHTLMDNEQKCQELKLFEVCRSHRLPQTYLYNYVKKAAGNPLLSLTCQICPAGLGCKVLFTSGRGFNKSLYLNKI